MPAPSRRIFLYWLLLLLPTLAVGTGALFLLRKEQARLDEQARGVAALRREAIAARARQAAENIELLVGEVQSGLMATLNEATAANPDAFLDSWGGSNPLVRSTFRLAADDRILRPVNGDARQWLAAWLATGAPWRSAARPAPAPESDEVRRERKDATANVTQAQNLRSRFQEAARQGVASDQTKKVTAPSVAEAVASAPERSGWTPWRGADGLHLIGWRQPSFGGVMGVEVNLATIIARLGELLPRDGDMADAFEVREAGVTRQSKIYGGGSLADQSSNRCIISCAQMGRQFSKIFSSKRATAATDVDLRHRGHGGEQEVTE